MTLFLASVLLQSTDKEKAEKEHFDHLQYKHGLGAEWMEVSVRGGICGTALMGRHSIYTSNRGTLKVIHYILDR